MHFNGTSMEKGTKTSLHDSNAGGFHSNWACQAVWNVQKTIPLEPMEMAQLYFYTDSERNIMSLNVSSLVC